LSVPKPNYCSSDRATPPQTHPQTREDARC
jgi:hypothetical protein